MCTHSQDTTLKDKRIRVNFHPCQWGRASLRGLCWLNCSEMNVFQLSQLRLLNFTYVLRHVLKQWLLPHPQTRGCHHKLSVDIHSFYPDEDVTSDLSLREHSCPLCTIFLQWQPSSLLLVTQASEAIMIRIPVQKTIWGWLQYTGFYI